MEQNEITIIKLVCADCRRWLSEPGYQWNMNIRKNILEDGYEEQLAICNECYAFKDQLA